MTQKDLRKIRAELSAELQKMTSSQREKYLQAAEVMYKGLSRMLKIRQTVKA